VRADGVKLRFHLPESEAEDEAEGPEGPFSLYSGAEREEEPDLGSRGWKALLYAVAAILVQIIWPLPLPLLVLFAIVGAGAAAAVLLEEGGLAIAVYLLFEFFAPSELGLHFIVGSSSAFVAGLSTSIGIATVVRGRRSEREDASRTS